MLIKQTNNKNTVKRASFRNLQKKKTLKKAPPCVYFRDQQHIPL